MSAALDDLHRLQMAAAPAPAPDRAKALDHARKLLAPALKERDAPVYPVDALGPLTPPCRAIAEHGQVRPAMVGQSLLGAASLLTQGLHNVETLAGQRPLSLNLLTLGDSGDGKTTAQNAALAPVAEWQRQEAKKYSAALASYEAAKSGRKKGQGPPEVPSCPFRLVGDATVEGLRRDLDNGLCSQGVFTDEAAAILCGYGMSNDHRAKTAGVFARLWDDGHLSFSRATGGRVERYGKRLALHWLVQPMAAAETVGDPLLSALGFWPRFLAAWPEQMEPRKAMQFKPGELPDVTTYWDRCTTLLALPLTDDASGCPVLPLTPAARARLCNAFERFEREARRGELQCIKPFVLRAAEQACRIAGVLAAFGNENSIGDDTMRSALALVAYSLQTWKAIVDGGAVDQRGIAALRLYEWLTTRANWCESLSVIVNGGPACVRAKDKRNAALEVLESAGLVVVANGKVIAMETGKESP